MQAKQIFSRMARLAWVSAALTFSGSALSQSAVKPDSAAEIATYRGSDRTQRILDGARREGSLSLYTSMDAVSSKKLKADFEKKYGIKLNLWRSSSENIVQRVTTEMRAGRVLFDVVETNGPEMQAIVSEGLLTEVVSPFHQDLIPQAVFAHRKWVATRLNVFMQGYNTDKVKPSEAPRSFQDLLDPRWKGKLAIESGDVDWFFTVVNNMGKEKGLQYFRELVAKNGVSVRKGHALIGQMLISGEVPYALTVSSFNIDQGKKSGAPISASFLGPLIVRPNGVGIANNAPHPYAAMLFYDYMISDAQNLMKEIDLVPVSRKFSPPLLANREVQFIDPKIAQDESPQWQKLFDEIFLGQTSAR